MADAGRVIAGRARSIRLDAPGPKTRPLGDRVKQTLFAILDPDLAGATVVDLFAGSGAAAIEALSRGAERAILVERDAGAVRVIRANLERTGLTERAAIVQSDVAAWLRSVTVDESSGWSIVFLDPPYDQAADLSAALHALGPLVRPGTRVIAKHFWRDAPPAQVGLLASERERRFGDTALTFYRRTEDP